MNWIIFLWRKLAWIFTSLSIAFILLCAGMWHSLYATVIPFIFVHIHWSRVLVGCAKKRLVIGPAPQAWTEDAGKCIIYAVAHLVTSFEKTSYHGWHHEIYVHNLNHWVWRLNCIFKWAERIIIWACPILVALGPHGFMPMRVWVLLIFYLS